jgi:precorrin-2/cobalt-factor-2 C20-methyltransferase
LGVGVGPGDPELMTLKAMRALAEADVIAHFAKAGNASHSRAIVAQHLRAGVTELPLLYPVTTELPTCSDGYRDALRDFYDAAAADIAAHLDAGRVVAVICEGDPLFYGSYMHLHARLAPRFSTEIVAPACRAAGRPPECRSHRATTCSRCFRRHYRKPSSCAGSPMRTPPW